MSRRTYTIEPQRLLAGSGYIPCEPHQASRIVILEITIIPPRGGRKRQHRIIKKVDEFHGAEALQRATERLGLLTRGTNPRPKSVKIWGRSLTRLEYDEVIATRSSNHK